MQPSERVQIKRRTRLPILLASFLTTFSAAGGGLLVGCFVQNDNRAVIFGADVTTLQVFVSGSFFPIPSSPLFHLFDHEIAWNVIFPATHPMTALQQAVMYGADPSQTGFRLAAAAALFLIGAFLFHWKVLRTSMVG